jgi:hypothetical protein
MGTVHPRQFRKKRPYSMFLLKTKYNWADEMDIIGFALMRPAEYDYLLREIRAIEYPIEVNVGSNQYIDFESAEEVLKKFDVSVLSLQQAESLRNMLHIHTLDEYGLTIFGSLQGNAPEEWYKENPYPEKEPT